ncbi:MAG: LytR/AlgR family response regulator transcription factor [Longibaculum sp.]
MGRLNIVCVEDDVEFAEMLEYKIKQYFAPTFSNVRIEVYHNIPEKLDFDSIDVMFFDMKIGEQDTLEYMRTIRESGYMTPFVIITGYDTYVFKTAHLHVYDFIKKSDLNKELKKTLDDLQDYFHYKSDYVVVPCKGEHVKIYIHDILYIELKAHHVSIQCRNHKEYVVWKDYQDIFNKEYISLVQSHRSYVINLNWCKSIDKKYAYFENNPLKAKVSQRRHPLVLDMMMERQNFF